jgi:glycosyltransferase involved in cell wall biosynthesis
MISLVMPVKNAEQFLDECLQSIVNQTYNDWELITVNDHSTDSSSKILSNYASKDERIHVYQNIGDGIIPALKLALSHTKGDCISRMDADDYMSPKKLELMLAKLQLNPNGIVTSYVRYFSNKTLGEGYLRYENWLNRLIDDDSHYKNIYKECVIPSPNWLMSKNTLNKIGGFDKLIYPEDYALSFNAYEHNVPVIGIKEVLHHWRDYPDRTSRTDAHYQDNSFLQLKMLYFLKLDYDEKLQLVLWGAGKKGKTLAKILLEVNVKFDWMTNNEKKLKVPIYGKYLTSTALLSESKPAQVLIAIATPSDQLKIEEQLKDYPKHQGFWFC